MTAREVYEGVLIELNKVDAPTMLLEDFNYLFNKSIYQYVNKKYNTLGVNQENTDSTQVLIGHTFLEPYQKPTQGENKVGSKNAQYSAAYKFVLPADYFHLLGCTCVYDVKKNHKCYNEGTFQEFQAIRLTADAWPIVMNNFYMKPSYKRPYYYIYNENTNVFPTDPIRQIEPVPNSGVSTIGHDYIPKQENVQDVANHNHVEDVHDNTEFPRRITLKLGDTTESVSTVSSYDSDTKRAGVRYGNPTGVILEIRCGKDNSIFDLQGVNIDYLKTPQHIRLTQEQLDYTEDKSQILEFPDYVCQEIINELVHIVMENETNPRLQTHIPVTTSIASPAQEQTQQRKK